MALDFNESVFDDIRFELAVLWAAHKQVGLTGQMCLYTMQSQEIFRSDEPGDALWFGPEDTELVIDRIRHLYRKGELPNSTPLLCPIVHTPPTETEPPQPLGSGIAWSTPLCLGIDRYEEESGIRILDTGAATSTFHRGENHAAGMKILFVADKVIPPSPGDAAVEGCRELYEFTQIKSLDYYPFYLLSGLNYLTKNGLFAHPSFRKLLASKPGWNTKMSPDETVAMLKANLQRPKDAAKCWHAYDHHHALYERFGIDAPNLERNLVYYNMCGRDFRLLSDTGPKHMNADTFVGFDFLVDGWVARGTVTVIGASGGTGKSSLAHNLAVKASFDYEPGEEPPTWLGNKLNPEKCKGIVVYFSGEDGPAVVHARAKIYDPTGRAQRLMFQRTDFGEGVSFSQFINRLYKMPDVPLLVVDPARKYLRGDEDDAGVVSEFFEALEEFAINKHSAVVVVHHLAKGAKPKEVSEIYDLLRGSQVFIDRPRAVIGMFREGNKVVAGLAKNNIPPQLGMVQGERVFHRNPKNLELEWIPGPDGVRHQELSEEELAELQGQIE